MKIIQLIFTTFFWEKGTKPLATFQSVPVSVIIVLLRYIFIVHSLLLTNKSPQNINLSSSE